MYLKTPATKSNYMQLYYHISFVKSIAFFMEPTIPQAHDISMSTSSTILLKTKLTVPSFATNRHEQTRMKAFIGHGSLRKKLMKHSGKEKLFQKNMKEIIGRRFAQKKRMTS